MWTMSRLEEASTVKSIHRTQVLFNHRVKLIVSVVCTGAQFYLSLNVNGYFWLWLSGRLSWQQIKDRGLVSSHTIASGRVPYCVIAHQWEATSVSVCLTKQYVVTQDWPFLKLTEFNLLIITSLPFLNDYPDPVTTSLSRTALWIVSSSHILFSSLFLQYLFLRITGQAHLFYQVVSELSLNVTMLCKYRENLNRETDMKWTGGKAQKTGH